MPSEGLCLRSSSNMPPVRPIATTLPNPMTSGKLCQQHAITPLSSKPSSDFLDQLLLLDDSVNLLTVDSGNFPIVVL